MRSPFLPILASHKKEDIFLLINVFANRAINDQSNVTIIIHLVCIAFMGYIWLATGDYI